MMHNPFFVFLILFAVGPVFSQDSIFLFSFFKDNGQDGLHLAYSQDGYSWAALNHNKSFLTPTAGKDKLMRDPCVIQGADGKFHMVWTVSWNEKGIGYANTTDLIHWSEQRYIPVMEHEPEARNCWAPEIFYDTEAGLYLIFWSTTIPGRFPETDSTGDNGYNHRMYYTVTSDFREFSEAKLFYEHGFNVIDGTLHKKSGEYVLFLKDETKYPTAEKNIRIATAKNLTGPYSTATLPITGHWVEGPTAAKIDGDWIVYFDMYTRHQMGAVSSQDLEHWSDISDKIDFPDGTRHGTIFKVSSKIFEGLRNYQN